MPFRNPAALLGLLSIIPLIIIYLIRPQPKEIRFSATQFLREGEAERSAVLSRLINDPLFWVQLVMLSLLSVAAAGPYMTDEVPASSHLVVVLDGSASMEASLSEAFGMIEPYLKGYQRISIVLAGSIPKTVLFEAGPSEASAALRQLSTKAVRSDLSGAMTRAAGLLGSVGGHILVVSDFISWIGEDPASTRKVLESDGRVSILFADCDRGGDNVALVEAWDVPGPGYVNHTVLLHNYGASRSVPVTIRGPGGETGRSLQIGSDEDYYLSFTAYPGENEVSLDLEDAVSWDNREFLYVPPIEKKRVLYLGDPGPALSALRSLPNADVRTSGSPDAADLVVLAKNAGEDPSLSRYLDGGRLIFLSDAQKSPEYLPVMVNGVREGPASLWVRNEGFTSGLHFNEIGLFHYPEARAREGSTILVEAHGAPVLSYWRLGEGLVLYSGLEMDSDFYMRPEYPIFWYQMLNWITDAPNIEQSNRRTGEVMHLSEPSRVATPSGIITSSSILLDECGFYRYQGTAVAASMYDPEESSLKRTGTVLAGSFSKIKGTDDVDRDYSNWVIAIALFALLLELFMMRRRKEA